jgi:circadian clock protein KaiB
LGPPRKSRGQPYEIRGPDDFDRLLRPARHYRLRLYIAGTNQNSFHAIECLRQLCDDVLPGKAELEVIDLYQQPELAQRDHIIAAPCLIKLSPLPRRIFIGDLSNRKQLLLGLGIPDVKRATENGGKQ